MVPKHPNLDWPCCVPALATGSGMWSLSFEECRFGYAILAAIRAASGVGGISRFEEVTCNPGCRRLPAKMGDFVVSAGGGFEVPEGLPTNVAKATLVGRPSGTSTPPPALTPKSPILAGSLLQPGLHATYSNEQSPP